MTTRTDGGPAFPVDIEGWGAEYGMSLRDWFAGQALGWRARKGVQVGLADTLAADAYTLADAMLKAREATDADH